MIRHADCSPVADFEMLWRNFYPRIAKSFYFAVKMFDVYNHSRSHNVDGIVTQNTGRKKVKNKFSFFVDYGVSGVVSALITAHHAVIFGEKVDYAPLTLVAPVDTHDCSKHFCYSFIKHLFLLLRPRRRYA